VPAINIEQLVKRYKKVNRELVDKKLMTYRKGEDGSKQFIRTVIEDRKVLNCTMEQLKIFNPEFGSQKKVIRTIEELTAEGDRHTVASGCVAILNKFGDKPNEMTEKAIKEWYHTEDQRGKLLEEMYQLYNTILREIKSNEKIMGIDTGDKLVAEFRIARTPRSEYCYAIGDNKYLIWEY